MVAVVNITYELFDNEIGEPLNHCKAYHSYNIVLNVKDHDELKAKLTEVNKSLEILEVKGQG